MTVITYKNNTCDDNKGHCYIFESFICFKITCLFPIPFRMSKEHHWSYSASYFLLFTIALTIQGKHRAMCNFSSTQNVGALSPTHQSIKLDFSSPWIHF